MDYQQAEARFQEPVRISLIGPFAHRVAKRDLSEGTQWAVVVELNDRPDVCVFAAPQGDELRSSGGPVTGEEPIGWYAYSEDGTFQYDAYDTAAEAIRALLAHPQEAE